MRGEERRGEERRGAGHQAAVCLDSIHDPSVCHCHSNSQRLQQDGKLHYHTETFSISVLSLSSSPHTLSLHRSVWPSVLLPTPPFFLSNPSETISTLFYPMSLFVGNLSLPLSFSPCAHSSLFASLSVCLSGITRKNVHRLRKLQSLYSFPITLATDTYINIRSRQLNILSTQLRILSIGTECTPPPK